MIKIKMADLESIAYNRGYLPYEFFMEIDPSEINQQRHKVYWIEETGQVFAEMWGVKMLVITLESAFYIIMLVFSVAGMVYGVFELFPSLKDCKFLKSFFE